MNLNETSKAGLIEPLAAVFFRVLAIILILGALGAALDRSLDEFLWSFFASPARAGMPVAEQSRMISLTFLIHLPIPLVLFAFSLRLARMVSRSLSRTLEPKPSN